MRLYPLLTPLLLYAFSWPRSIRIRLMTQPAAKRQPLGAELTLKEVSSYAKQVVHQGSLSDLLLSVQ